MVRNGQANIQQAREASLIVLVAVVTGGQDPNANMQLAELQNQVAQANYEVTIPVPIEMTESEKTQYNLEWNTYQQRKAHLISIEDIRTH